MWEEPGPCLEGEGDRQLGSYSMLSLRGPETSHSEGVFSRPHKISLTHLFVLNLRASNDGLRLCGLWWTDCQHLLLGEKPQDANSMYVRKDPDYVPIHMYTQG